MRECATCTQANVHMLFCMSLDYVLFSVCPFAVSTALKLALYLGCGCPLVVPACSLCGKVKVVTTPTSSQYCYGNNDGNNDTHTVRIYMEFANRFCESIGQPEISLVPTSGIPGEFFLLCRVPCTNIVTPGLWCATSWSIVITADGGYSDICCHVDHYLLSDQ